MFTGLVQDVGRVRRIEAREQAWRLSVEVGEFNLAAAHTGDSIAVAGVCLTVVGLDARSFEADVSGETRALTTIGDWRVGRRVNLECSLKAGDPLGGHLLLGHVDGTAELLDSRAEGGSQRLALGVPPSLARYIARKGSVALDGVSLTVTAVQDSRFEVAVVPHTLAVTTLGALTPGARLNLEVDLMARYIERILSDTGRLGQAAP